MIDPSKLQSKHVFSIPPPIIISIQFCFCKWIIQNTQSNKGSFNVTIKARISQLRGHTSPNYGQPTSPLSQRSIARAAYLQGQPSSLNIIDAAIQHFLLVILPSMVLPTWQEYHSSLLKATDALLVVTVHGLRSNPSIHPSSTALKIFLVIYHPRCSRYINIYVGIFLKFEFRPI